MVASHFLFCPPCPYVCPTPLLLKRCCFSFGGFFSCLSWFLFLLVLVRRLPLLFLALLLLPLGLCLVRGLLVRRLSLCVLLLVRSLVGLWWRSSRLVLLLVRSLLVPPGCFLLPRSPVVRRLWWLVAAGFGGALLFLCRLPGVLFLPPAVLSSSLLCVGADSFLLGVRPPFFANYCKLKVVDCSLCSRPPTTPKTAIAVIY